MVGLLIEGVGVIVSGVSVHYILQLITGNGSNANSLYTSFFNTLMAGVITAGVGIIVIGVSFLFGSKDR